MKNYNEPCNFKTEIFRAHRKVSEIIAKTDIIYHAGNYTLHDDKINNIYILTVSLSTTINSIQIVTIYRDLKVAVKSTRREDRISRAIKRLEIGGNQ